MTAADVTASRITVERWPTEEPLFALAIAASLLLWLALAISVIGIVYVALIGVFFFMVHALLVYAVRGNGVRLGPDQFPELHARVEYLARAFGMQRAPEAYLMQAGGALNAFATRFLRANMIVLYSDLLDACGDNAAARDMIIAHELGHVAAGHLRLRWLILPASVVPFLGTALSRAREYTCDRYGIAGAGDRHGALLGLTILATGGRLAPQVNRTAFVRQAVHLNTGWMTLGEWLSTHPPLCKRVAALDQSLALELPGQVAGTLRALAIVGLALAVPAAGVLWAGRVLGPAIKQVTEHAQARRAGEPAGADESTEKALKDLQRMGQAIDAEIAQRRAPPATQDAVYRLWRSEFGGTDPLDPFDGQRYRYQVEGWDFRLWSVGPDGKSGTDDDIVVRSGLGTR